MKVNEIIIHELIKSAGGNAKMKAVPKKLPLNAVHEKFMTEVRDVYYKKSNPIYGVFDPVASTYPFQTFLADYLADDDFYRFSTRSLTHFEKIINTVSNATSSYVLFCDFEDSERYMAVIMLNDTGSFLIDKQKMDIAEGFRLDIDKLEMANFSNCNKWQNKEDVYLSFTPGRKDVSNYFKTFIGTTDYASAKGSSDKLQKALIDYLIGQKTSQKEMEVIKTRVFEHCRKQMDLQMDISLTTLSAIVNPANAEGFKEFAADEKYGVSNIFKGHPSLKSLKYFAYSSTDLSITFDSKLLDEQIFYNAEQNELLIRNVPKKLKAQLTNEQPGPEQE